MKGLLATRPYLRPMIWAGDRLGRAPGEGGKVGEALDVSGLSHMPSLVCEDGAPCRSLCDAYGEWGKRLVGGTLPPPERLPLLVKRIDAGDNLSVQVHPDDRLARRLEGEPNGKSEAWVILAAEPGASILLGFRDGVDRSQAEEALRAGRPREVLREIVVRPGDVVPVPAGCVHAIGKGIFLFEVQQPSAVTYRLHDTDRPGAGGARPLHHAEGFQAMDLEARPVVRPSDIFRAEGASGRRILCEMPTFRIEACRLREERDRERIQGGNLAVVQVVTGEARLSRGEDELVLAGMGATALVPAEGGDWSIASSEAALLLAFHR